MDKDLQHRDSKYWTWGCFYFNRSDSRVIVPKRIEWLGWTFNFAHPVSYVILILLLIFIPLFAFFFK